MRTAKQRTIKYAAGLDPLEIYLKIKKQKNLQDMIIGVQTLKDEALNALLIPYDLDTRLNVLALRAWRELYFMRYKSKQKVVISEPT